MSGVVLDASLVNDQWQRFTYCRDRGHLDFLTKADKCDKFFLGLQWSQEDLVRLNLQRRPALTINKILSTLSSVMGEQIFNRSEVLFRPAGGSPAETAEALTKIWMQIVQNNQLQWTRSDVAADGFIRSRGFYDVRMDFDDAMQGEVRISMQNSKNVIVDPDAEEYDPDNWNDVFISKWMTPQDIAVLYDPEAAEALKNDAASSYPYGFDRMELVRDRFAGQALNSTYYGISDPEGVRRNVRVLERQFHMTDKQLHFVDLQTGDMRPVPEGWERNRIAALLEKAGGRLGTMKKLVKRVKWRVTAGNYVLHDAWSPYKHFTIVPYFPHFHHGQTMGIVENLLGPQELLNKTSSQELHIVNTTANSGWKMKAGSLVNMTVGELEQRGAETGLVLEMDDVNNIEKISPNTVPTGLERISYKAEEHIKTISGVSDSMQGFDREDVAAKAIAYKQQRGSANFAKVLDNLERTDFLLARNVLDLVQAFYSEERIITITHDDPTREAETITVNQMNPETGEITNDLTLGEYKIVITSTPYRATMEDSQFEQAMAMREKGIAIPDSVLIENSRLNRKADIVKQMAGDQESPEALQRKQLEMRALEADVAEKEAKVAKMGADSELSGARAQKTLVDAEKVAGEDNSGQMEMQKMQQEMEIQRQKMEQEHALAVEKMEREFALKREQMQREMALQEKYEGQRVMNERIAAERSAQAQQSKPTDQGDQP